jgi:hypothetical protein
MRSVRIYCGPHDAVVVGPTNIALTGRLRDALEPAAPLVTIWLCRNCIAPVAPDFIMESAAPGSTLHSLDAPGAA